MRFVFKAFGSYLAVFQLSFFFLVGFLFHRTWQWGAGFCLAFLVSLACELYGRAEATLKTVKGVMENFFDTPSNWTLDEVDITPLIPENVRQRLFFRRPLESILKDRVIKPIRAFVVRYSKPPFPAQLKAYGNADGTGMIFLRDKPEDFAVLERFKLYHELGHLSAIGTRLEQQVCASAYRRCYTMAAIIPTLYFEWWIVPLSLIYVLQQAYKDITMRVRAELYADSFAIEAIEQTGSLPQLLADLQEYYADESNSILTTPKQLATREKLGFQVQFEYLLLSRMRQSQFNQAKQRLAKNKPLGPVGLSIIGPGDILMGLLFMYLAARYAVFPGSWFFLILGAIFVALIWLANDILRYTPVFQNRLDGIISSPSR